MTKALRLGLAFPQFFPPRRIRRLRQDLYHRSGLSVAADARSDIDLELLRGGTERESRALLAKFAEFERRLSGASSESHIRSVLDWIASDGRLRDDDELSPQPCQHPDSRGAEN